MDRIDRFDLRPGDEVRYRHHLVRLTTRDGLQIYTVFGKVGASRGRPFLAHFDTLKEARRFIDAHICPD